MFGTSSQHHKNSGKFKEKKVFQQLFLSDYLFYSLVPVKEPQQLLSYLVEFVTRLNEFSKSRLFIEGWVHVGRRVGGGGVRVVCLRGGGPHPPCLPLSRRTGLRVQWSPAFVTEECVGQKAAKRNKQEQTEDSDLLRLTLWNVITLKLQ